MAKKPKKDIPTELGKLDDWDDIPPLEEPKKNLDLPPLQEPEQDMDALPELQYVPIEDSEGEDEQTLKDLLMSDDIPHVRAINRALTSIPPDRQEFCLLYCLSNL